MKNTPSVRTMGSDDWNMFHQVDIDIFPDDPLDEDWFTRRLERDGFFALDLDGTLIGMLVVAPFGDSEGHLGRIGVAKPHQGKGYSNLLMSHAVEWFRQQGSIKQVHLYTQDFNTTAQSLYKKFGFKVSGTTWHYFVPFASLSPLNRYACQEIMEEEIDMVGHRYEEEFPAVQIRRFLTYDEFKVMTLKDDSGQVVGACRFTPGFPGCFPFMIDTVDCFDDFIAGLHPFSLAEYDYVRVTFTDNPDLAKICDERGYKLHHRLYKMTLDLV